MSGGAVVVFPDAAAIAVAAAERVVAAARAAVAAHGRFTFVLSGGATPKALYETLAAAPWRDRVPWDRTHVFFGDERCVPPDHPQSNYGMALESLLSRVPVPLDQIHRMKGELPGTGAAASAYEAELRGVFAGESSPAFDLLLLGMGADGHTASLFPGTAALEETSRWVVPNYVPKLDAWRITLTYPALNAARFVLFLITGTDKAGIVAEAFGGAAHAVAHPVESVAPPHGLREVLVDEAAAAQLPRG